MDTGMVISLGNGITPAVDPAGGGSIFGIKIPQFHNLLTHAEPLKDSGGDVFSDGGTGDFAHGFHGFFHIGEDGIGSQTQTQALQRAKDRLVGTATGICLTGVGQQLTAGCFSHGVKRLDQFRQFSQTRAFLGADGNHVLVYVNGELKYESALGASATEAAALRITPDTGISSKLYLDNVTFGSVVKEEN